MTGDGANVNPKSHDTVDIWTVPRQPSIWRKIEQLHPEVEVWETVTPYFDRRNVYFYLNVCGFHAVEFLRDEEMPEDGNMVNAANEAGMLRFEKRMTE